MFVMVANKIADASFVGPSHAATTRGQPSPSDLLIASPATTGSSTNKPSARINDAMEICCTSSPSSCMKPKVIAKVIGMHSAINSADRHSQNPISATITTKMIASYKLDMNSSTASSTCSG